MRKALLFAALFALASSPALAKKAKDSETGPRGRVHAEKTDAEKAAAKAERKAKRDAAKAERKAFLATLEGLSPEQKAAKIAERREARKQANAEARKARQAARETKLRAKGKK